MTSTATEYQFPKISHGTRVVVSNDPSQSDREYGWVLTPKAKCADILVASSSGRWMIRYDCWHIGDPRCRQFPDRFDGESGVFELAPDEVQQRDVFAKLDGIETFLIQVADRMTSLEDRLAALEQGPSEKPSRRGKE